MLEQHSSLTKMLGSPRSQHTATKMRTRGNLISGFVFIILGLLAFVLAGIAARTETGTSVVNLCGGVGLVGIVGGGWALWAYRQERDMVVTLFSEGIQVTRNGRSQQIRWDAVSNLSLIMVYNARIASTLTTYTLTTANEHTLLLDLSQGNLTEPEHIAHTIQKEVTTRQLFTAVTSLDAGQRLNFGPFAISAAGLHHGTEMLAWADVAGVNFSRRGTLLVYAHPKGDTWARADLARVENVFTLCALVERLAHRATSTTLTT